MQVLWAAGSLVWVGCAERKVTRSLTQTAAVEGRRYANEVKAQSPFSTVEMRWIEARELIKTRNPAFVDASQRHTAALQGKPLVAELTREMKDTMRVSFGDMFDTDSLISSLKSPTIELPKRLASFTKLKDLSHEVEQGAWQDAGASVDAELDMRKVEVKLHRLLRMGKLLDREQKRAKREPDPEASSDPKFPAALAAWRSGLEKEREKWLTEVRDLFDAEYQDVHFIPDDSGFPTYRSAANPDLTDWKRWSHLQRSRGLIGKLTQSHQANKPAIPGTELVKGSLLKMVGREKKAETVRETDDVRKEVRSLIQSWRSMKKAQKQAAALEEKSGDAPVASIADVTTRQTIFKLRSDEIRQASVVWLLDENCWQGTEIAELE